MTRAQASLKVIVVISGRILGRKTTAGFLEDWNLENTKKKMKDDL